MIFKILEDWPFRGIYGNVTQRCAIRGHGNKNILGTYVYSHCLGPKHGVRLLSRSKTPCNSHMFSSPPHTISLPIIRFCSGIAQGAPMNCHPFSSGARPDDRAKVSSPNPNSNPLSRLEFLPGCLYLGPTRVHMKQLLSGFFEEGFRLEFVKSLAELKYNLKNKRNFLVFVESDFHPDAISWLRSLGPTERRQFYWIVLTRSSKTSRTAQFFQMGASDVLTPPVHPHIARGRAQLFIKRYLNLFTFPENTVLPPGVLAQQTGKITVLPNAAKSEDEDNLIQLINSVGTANGGSGFPRLGLPFRERYKPEMLKIVESIHSLFRQKEKVFNEVKTKADQKALLSIASIEQSPITLWCRSPRLLMETAVLHFAPEENTFLINTNSSEKFLQETRGKSIYCHLRLELSSVFFLGQIQESASFVELRSSDKIYQVQRRASMRMDVPESMGRIVELQMPDGTKLRAEAVDLSSTGMQIRVAPELESQILTLAKVDVRYQLDDGLLIEGSGQMRWKKIKGDWLAIGIHFLGVSSHIQDEIGFRIFEHYGNSLEGVFK
jgi:hypothetical protein